jgi:epsilon-lactone hydrolase
MPAALVPLTPEVDLTESGDSFQTNVGIDTLPPLLATNRLYANGHDLAHPYLSPLFGDLTGLPPTFLQTGTRDLSLSNTVRMHRRLLAPVSRSTSTSLRPWCTAASAGTHPRTWNSPRK